MSTNENDIAVIGMSCRFPGAPNVDRYWENLRGGVESIATFSRSELEDAGVDSALLDRPEYVRAGPVLDDVDLFDAAFFGFSPRDAEILDPQQRLFLECAWAAIESAGHTPKSCEGMIGTYAGAGISRYLFQLLSDPQTANSTSPYQLLISNDKDHLTSRVAYKLDLKGPAVTIQTTCSTSLVAICHACQALLNYHCDLALAGGSSILLPQRAGYVFQPGGIASPDGHCRAFDAAAEGTIGGSGVGVVVLRRLADALDDGDPVRAVIRGFAVNNDGSDKVGYTAPSVNGQAEVIEAAMAFGEIEPRSVAYIEAHGTGTPLGDPIEVAALTKAFGHSKGNKPYCGLGSAKSNFGHLDAAAGVAGFIKTVLALEHEAIPPTLHFERPNPQIDFANSPFYVVDSLQEWKRGRQVRRAGVSSFGIGGTNAHVVLEEAPVAQANEGARPWHLIVLSAKSDSALEAATANLSDDLAARSDHDQCLADVAYTLQVGREAHARRRMTVCETALSSALEALKDGAETSVAENVSGVAFLISGQGSQYPGMDADLYEYEPYYRQQMDDCCERLRPHLDFDLRDVFTDTGADQRLRQTAVTQPALFAMQYSLAQLWISWGVRPCALAGHSLGEFVAACLAGVLSLDDALALVAARGRLMQGLQSGTMLAVTLSESELQPMLGDTVALAVVNGPTQCVASGPDSAIADLAGRLDERGVSNRRLDTSHAFHSQLVEPAMEELTRVAKSIEFSPPCVPYLSNSTGTWITEHDACDAGYWARHMRQTVRFSDNLRELIDVPDAILLEIGPGNTLATLAKLHPNLSEDRLVLSSLPHARDSNPAQRSLLQAAGRLWLAGVPIDWHAFHAPHRRKRMVLPTYPFDRQRFWIEPQSVQHDRVDPAPRIPRAVRHGQPRLYVPSWKRQPLLPGKQLSQSARWLVFADQQGMGDRFANRVRQGGHLAVTVQRGDAFIRDGDGSFTVRPNVADDYMQVLRVLREESQSPDLIVNMWGLIESAQSAENGVDSSFHDALCLARAIAEVMPDQACRLAAVVEGGARVHDEKITRPEHGLVDGLLAVVPQELENMKCKWIDVATPWDEAVLEGLLAECATDGTRAIAYRNGDRYVRKYSQFWPRRVRDRLRKGGTYLITGGLGGLGLEVAVHLARRCRANLVLVGRRMVETEAQAEKIRAIEQLGSEVMSVAADVTERPSMERAIESAILRFGSVNGVVHCAGVPGGGVIQLKSSEQAARVLAPKVGGARVLVEAFREHDLDFVVLFSSLASIVGGPGQSDYCAANAYLDAFAESEAFGERTFVTAVNWDTWTDVGMAVEATKNLVGQNPLNGLETKEALSAFDRVLSADSPQVIVSVADLQPRLRNRQAPAPPRQQPSRQGTPNTSTGQRHPRPNLAVPFVAPRSQAERQIAAIWEELLGIQKIGIHDGFLELGGHSLLAIQVVSRLRSAFAMNVSVRTLFDAPTIAELAPTLSGQAPATTQQPPTTDELERIDALLRRVEDITPDELSHEETS